jgi:hypothetical protein
MGKPLTNLADVVRKMSQEEVTCPGPMVRASGYIRKGGPTVKSPSPSSDFLSSTFSPIYHLIISMASSSSNTAFASSQSRAARRRHGHVAREATPFIFNEAGHTVGDSIAGI